jgi:hypothetical protein
MKNLRSVLFVLAVLLLATASRAQQNAVKADVPFDFAVGDRAYPAGEYTLKSALHDAGIMRLDNTQEPIVGFIPSNSCENAAPSKETKLVFHRVGSRYFLYQVWIAGNLTGREFPKGRAEVEYARNQDKQELVIVAARLTR